MGAKRATTRAAIACLDKLRSCEGLATVKIDETDVGRLEEDGHLQRDER